MSKKQARLIPVFAVALTLGVAVAADKDTAPKNQPDARRTAGQDLPCAEDPPVKTDLKKKSTTKKGKAATTAPAKP